MPAITMQMSRSCVDPPFLPQPPLDFSLPPHTLTELKELQSYLGSFLTGGVCTGPYATGERLLLFLCTEFLTGIFQT